jgi:hypothetical protein
MAALRVVRDADGRAALADAYDRIVVDLSSDRMEVAYVSGFEPDRPFHMEHSESVTLEGPFRAADFAAIDLDTAIGEIRATTAGVRDLDFESTRAVEEVP